MRLTPLIWERFGEAAKAIGWERATLLRAVILWYCRYPGAELPERPPENSR